MNSSLTLSKHLVKFLIPVKFKLQGGDSGGRGSVSSQSSVGLDYKFRSRPGPVVIFELAPS